MTSDLNLLPPPRRLALLKQSMVQDAYRLLTSITMGLLLVTLVGIGSIGILQSFISAASSEKSAELEHILRQYTTLKESVAAQNVFLSAMGGLVEHRLVWSEKLYELLATIPGGVHIERISGKGNEKPTISFSGEAATRNALIILEQRLQGLTWADSVDAPNSNLIDRTNAPYEFIIPLK